MVWKKARLGVQFKNAKTFINNALAFFLLLSMSAISAISSITDLEFEFHGKIT